MSMKKMQKLVFYFLVVFTLIAGGSSNGFAELSPPGNLKIGYPSIVSASWTKVANTRLDAVSYNWSPNSTPGYFAGIMQAWSGGAFDTTRNRLLIYGGGHTDYGGQEIYAFDMDTMTWSRVSDPEAYSALDADCTHSGYTDNGLPKAQHSYGRLAYIPYSDSLCTTEGSVGYASCDAARKLDCYSLTADSWNTGIGADPQSGGSASFGAVDPDTGEWWLQGVSGSGKLGHYTPSTGTWEYGAYDNDFAYANKYVTAVIDPKRNLFVAIGGGGVWAMPLSSFSAGSTELVNYAQSTTGDSAIINAAAPGAAYDPVHDKVIAWSGGAGVYVLDLDTWVWSKINPSGDIPTAAQTRGTYGRFQYSAKNDQFVAVNAVDQDVYILSLNNSEGSSSTSGEITSFNLTSAVSGSVPFTVGVGFKEGDVTGTPTLDLTDYQVKIKRTWPDGSVKHAIFSGVYISATNTSTKVHVYADGSTPSGTDLTEADIVNAAPNASVNLGSYGTVYLSSLLATPQRVWISGPEMIEAHYISTLSLDPYIAVKFHVRLYKSGKMFVRAIVENGNLIGGTSSTITYAPTIVIDGNTVFNNGGSILTQYAHQRYDVTGWIGSSDPQTTIAQDTPYLMATGLVPNYWKTGPSQTALNSLTQNYTPLQKGDWTASMGATGYQIQIGLLPLWDALYINSFGNASAFKAVIANARSINSYPLSWPDPNTGDPIVISDRPTYTVGGDGGGGATGVGAGSLTWDVAHHGSAAYLAYLITGDYYYLETMQYQADLCFLVTNSSNGSGWNRLILPVQTRGVAWATRTYGQLAGIAPTGRLTDDVASMLNFTAAYWRGVIEQPGMNTLGYIYSYEVPSNAYGTGFTAPWQQHFWVQSLGYISDLEYSADMTNFDFVKRHMYKSIVGFLGGNGVDEYCYTEAAKYTIKISATSTSDPTAWYDSWGTVFTATTGGTNTSCGTTLGGYVGSDAKTTYWGNLLPALAYAVDDGATGALDSFNRVINADNWPAIENGGWEDIPIWGVWPRSVSAN